VPLVASRSQLLVRCNISYLHPNCLRVCFLLLRSENMDKEPTPPRGALPED
jgi:hypothetical protein